MNDVQLGTLAVRLKMDASQLQRDAAKNARTLKGMTEEVSDRFNIMAKVAAGAMTGVAVGMGVIVRAMINEAAKLDGVAQEIGATTEQLSGLKYAGEQAGIPFETLTQSMTKLNQALGAMAGGAGENMPAAMALNALGISATDATGKVKASSDVLLEVATKFSTYEDGANKASLAMALFGEQGVKLTPLLNRGAAGISELTAEAERLGVVIDGDTARVAKEFNEVMGKLEASGRGLAMAVGERLLPDLKLLAEVMQSATEDSKPMGIVVDGIAIGVKTLASAVLVAAGNIAVLGGSLKTLYTFARDFVTVGWDKAIESSSASFEELKASIQGVSQTLEQLWGAGNQEDSPFFTLGAKLAEQSAQVPKAVAPAMQAAVDLTNQFAAARAAARGMLDDLINSPTEDIATKIAAITQAAREGTIGFQELGRLMKQVTDQQQQNLDMVVMASTGALNAMFGENKGVATATALINTYQAITKALASAPPPLSYALAAATAAQGFAQVKAIRATNREFGGPVRAGEPYIVGERRPELFVPSQSGHIVPRVPSAYGRDMPTGNVTMTVHGINPRSLFTGESMREIAEEMLRFQRNGGRVVLA